jgi:hypothetical protein
VLRLLDVHQAQVRLVDQRRRLQRLPRLLLREPPGRELAQFFVNQGEQLPGGTGVAVLDGRQNAGDVFHHRSA